MVILHFAKPVVYVVIRLVRIENALGCILKVPSHVLPIGLQALGPCRKFLEAQVVRERERISQTGQETKASGSFWDCHPRKPRLVSEPINDR